MIDGNGEGILFSGESGLASSDNVATRNIVSNASVRYNVESWWPVGNPIGTGNVASDNCIWNGAQGNVAAQVGFTAVSNKVVNPLYANRAAKDFQLQSGSPCAGYGPAGTAPAPTPPVTPAPPVTPIPAPASAPANRKLPTISGTVKVGQQLGGTTGDWSGTTPMTFSYAWQRCDLNGANCATTGKTGASYSVVNADVGHMMRLVVLAQNSMGQASATSGQSGSSRQEEPQGLAGVQAVPDDEPIGATPGRRPGSPLACSESEGPTGSVPSWVSSRPGSAVPPTQPPHTNAHD